MWFFFIVRDKTYNLVIVVQPRYVIVTGGPGSGKGTQCKRILERYEGFVHLSMGDIIRTEISKKGTADDKWGMITQLMSKGEMAPEVTLFIDIHRGMHSQTIVYNDQYQCMTKASPIWNCSQRVLSWHLMSDL